MSSRLYGLQRWRRRAAHQLVIEPLCRMCLAAGLVVAATVADHVIPHRGDEHAFWHGELQSLCTTHHSSVKQREEAHGYADVLDADGWPADPRHPANHTPGGTQISTGLRSATGGGPRCAAPQIFG